MQVSKHVTSNAMDDDRHRQQVIIDYETGYGHGQTAGKQWSMNRQQTVPTRNKVSNRETRVDNRINTQKSLWGKTRLHCE